MTESIQILVEKDRLQPLADNIKVLKGSDTITLQQMEDTIEETNTDLVSQTDLIAQLMSALQGKSVPSDGGSSGGGALEYVTGTCAPDVDVAKGEKAFSITGIGFKPRFVLIQHDVETSSGHNSMILGEDAMALLAATGGLINIGSAYYRMNGSNHKYASNSSVASITMDDDGFTVYNGSFALARFKGYAYTYIAIK